MYQKIVLAFDGTKQGRLALREGANIAALCKAETHLIAVMRGPSDIALAEGVYPVEALRAEQESVRLIIEEGLARLRNRGLMATGHLAFGEPVDCISQLVNQIGADLLVVGHQKEGALQRWWRGSVGHSLLDLVNCSLLIVIPNAASIKAAEQDAVHPIDPASGIEEG